MPLCISLAKSGGGRVSSFGYCPDAPPQCIAGMCAVSLETLSHLALIKLRYLGLGLLADFVVHGGLLAD